MVNATTSAVQLHRFSGAALALLLALAPGTARAHEKWFTPYDTHPVDWSLVLSARTLIASVAAGAIVALFFMLQRLVGDSNWPRLPFFHRMARGSMTLLAVQSAITLIYVSVQPALLAPNLLLPREFFGFALAAVQIAVAFSFITGLLDRAGAVGLGLLWLVALVLYGPVNAAEQLLYVGIAVAIFIIGRASLVAEEPREPFDTAAWGAHAIAALRMLSGAAFLALGLFGKVWNPDMGRTFLQEHPGFNLLQAIGLEWFTDDRFIMLAGIVEITIGALLLAGLLTRVVIVGMFVPFNLTVPFLPPVEMIGHLPIFGVMYVLLVYGSGSATTDVHLPTEEERATDERKHEARAKVLAGRS